MVNPPWTLEAELTLLLPALADVLGRDGKGRFTLDWLAGEAPGLTLTPLFSSKRPDLVSSSVLAVTFRLLSGGRRSD